CWWRDPHPRPACPQGPHRCQHSPHPGTQERQRGCQALWLWSSQAQEALRRVEGPKVRACERSQTLQGFQGLYCDDWSHGKGKCYCIGRSKWYNTAVNVWGLSAGFLTGGQENKSLSRGHDFLALLVQRSWSFGVTVWLAFRDGFHGELLEICDSRI